MKWRNHKLVAFAAIYSVTGGFISACSSMAGSVLPDVLELNGVISHRTVTHYVWFWVVSCLSLWLLLCRQGFSSINLYCAFFIIVGGLLHVCVDALSVGGVPVYTPFGKKVGLKVYRTNTLSEEMAAAGLLLVFSCFAWAKGYLASDYFLAQFQLLIRFVGRLCRF